VDLLEEFGKEKKKRKEKSLAGFDLIPRKQKTVYQCLSVCACVFFFP
jgi:hypothetical protein